MSGPAASAAPRIAASVARQGSKSRMGFFIDLFRTVPTSIDMLQDAENKMLAHVQVPYENMMVPIQLKRKIAVDGTVKTRGVVVTEEDGQSSSDAQPLLASSPSTNPKSLSQTEPGALSTAISSARKIFSSLISAEVDEATESSETLYINTIVIRGRNRQSSSKNPPLVMAHGFGAGLGFFAPNLTEELCNDRDVYLFDWIGNGRSSRPENIPLNSTAETEEYMAASLESWRINLGLEQIDLIGHSLGGYLSSVYAINHPNKVRKLLLASPVGIGERPPFSERIVERPWWQRAAAGMIEGLYEKGLTPQSIVRGLGANGPTQTEKIVSRRFAHMEDTSRISAISKYIYHLSAQPASGEKILQLVYAFGAVARSPIMPRLKTLQCDHVTFFFGSHDWVDKTGCDTLCEDPALTNNVPARLEIVPDAGHHLYMDNAPAWNALVLRELRQ